MELLDQLTPGMNWGDKARDLALEVREHLAGEITTRCEWSLQHGTAALEADVGPETGVRVDVWAHNRCGFYLSVFVTDVDGDRWERHTEMGPFARRYHVAGWILQAISKGLERVDDRVGTDTRRSLTVPGWATC